MFTVLIKGTRADAVLAAEKREIPLMNAVEIPKSSGNYWSNVRALVPDPYAAQLARWFTEDAPMLSEKPYGFVAGTLLHYAECDAPVQP